MSFDPTFLSRGSRDGRPIEFDAPLLASVDRGARED